VAFLGSIFDNSVAPTSQCEDAYAVTARCIARKLIYQPEAQARVWWIEFEFFESCRKGDLRFFNG